MVISAVTGATSPVTMNDLPKVETGAESKIVRPISTKEAEKVMSTEEYVREYFKDIPIMVEIARCESTFQHLDKSGEIKRGKVNQADVGVMQINEFYHLDTAEKRDHDIYTIEGNMSYARDLYERQGTRPWNSSKPCWGKYENKEIALNK